MKGIKKSGLILAGAAAALLASGFVATATGAEAAKEVKCSGANACKGKSECKSKDNMCKGQNQCKAKGWVTMKSEAACKKAGGTVMMEEKKGS